MSLNGTSRSTSFPLTVTVPSMAAPIRKGATVYSHLSGLDWATACWPVRASIATTMHMSAARFAIALLPDAAGRSDDAPAR